MTAVSPIPTLATSGNRYQQVTDRIFEALSRGVPPWNRPWAMIRPVNAVSKRPYQSINRLLLELRAFEAGYRSSRWITFGAAKTEGGFVKRGERGTTVLYYAPFERARPEHDGDQVAVVDADRRFFVKSYTLFNLDQTHGLEHLREPVTLDRAHEDDAADQRAQDFLTATGARIRYGGDVAAYYPTLDVIMLPPRTAFASTAGFFGTAAHELAHWSGAAHRLNRLAGGKFGDPKYAFEELVAELTAAFLCAEVGLAVQTTNSAAYLKGWLSLLSDDASAIISAARLAQEAADYLSGFVGYSEQGSDSTVGGVSETAPPQTEEVRTSAT